MIFSTLFYLVPTPDVGLDRSVTVPDRKDRILTPAGCQQALQWVRVLKHRKPVAIYTSPNISALALAVKLGGGDVPVAMRNQLKERDYGSWAGQPWRDIRRDYMAYENYCEDPDFAPPGGESYRQAGDRAAELLQSLAWTGDRVILVGHPEINQALLAWVMQLPWDRTCELADIAAQITMIRFAQDRFEVKQLSGDFTLTTT
ncbi:MAG: histidine phosphatase family protein [Planctomycetaceae bacterium]|nr:MAG: histidine phosphatase family protein [Planctomycetaceae bacterium]